MTQVPWNPPRRNFKPTDSEVGAREQVVRQRAPPHRLRYCDLTGYSTESCETSVPSIGFGEVPAVATDFVITRNVK
jgi:hypothetical protein